jgi:uncharacterized protein YdiU (UPF0061 family)
VLREFLVSEAMAAHGRAHDAGPRGGLDRRASLDRETALPGAVLARVAASHIRVGTFQFFAARGDTDSTRLLVDHVLGAPLPRFATGPRIPPSACWNPA